MNKVIEQLQNRRSVRNFTGEKVKDEDLELILRTAQRAPSSVNGQQISLIVTRDKEKLKKIAEICGGQGHIANSDVFITILIDYHRGQYASKSINRPNVAAHTADGILVGAIDAGIMLTSIQAAAESLGYGATTIGALRRDPQALIDLFELPQGVFPVLGTTLGVPGENPHKTLKPRVPFESFAFVDKYDGKKVEEGVEIHEKETIKWREEDGTSQLPTYKEMIDRIYGQSLLETKKNLEKQGFEFTDNPNE